MTAPKLITPKSVAETQGVAGITFGTYYVPESIDYVQGFVVIQNDNGFLRTYDIHRFLS